MDTCIFCQIVSGTSPAYTIYEDDQQVAFLDLYPHSDGHTLLIPKTHYRWIWDINALSDFFKVAQKITHHYERLFNVETCYTFSLGEAVPHAHLHIIPATIPASQNILSIFSQSRQGRLDPAKAKALTQKLKLT